MQDLEGKYAFMFYYYLSVSKTRAFAKRYERLYFGGNIEPQEYIGKIISSCWRAKAARAEQRAKTGRGAVEKRRRRRDSKSTRTMRGARDHRDGIPT